ncbi:MAG TPA: HAD family phosphatase [Terriglobales bacterium]|nr:HAD family phosphatase [Terriglobales bacterium]
MAEITTLFWDVGGVLLTNGWDRDTRRAAAVCFGLNEEELEQRHEALVSALETGKISLDDYLERTVFCHPQSFSREEFKTFIHAQSRPNPDSLALARELSGKYLMAAINNESLELNLYRIEKFGLREIFTAFFSSCFVRLRKPDPAIYRLALDVTQKTHEGCCFIDDRPLNLDGARQAGMRVIQFQDTNQLRRELAELGVATTPAVPAA